MALVKSDSHALSYCGEIFTKNLSNWAAPPLAMATPCSSDKRGVRAWQDDIQLGGPPLVISRSMSLEVDESEESVLWTMVPHALLMQPEFRTTS